jgi:hypothetical protein
MGKLEYYSSLDEKKDSFSDQPEAEGWFTIDSAYQFKNWYDSITNLIKLDPLGNFFRGAGEARYKLYNSSQRFWIENNLTQLESLSQWLPYISMIQNMVNKAKEQEVFKRVFDYYGLADDQTDFPILSILQHYGAPTPFMDWTYDINVALFFAVERTKHFEKENQIENYVSIYRIIKGTDSEFIRGNIQVMSGNFFPTITYLSDNFPNSIYYISDFEVKNERQIRPLTTYYNLNIMPQQGLFIFNPHERDPLEKIAVEKYPESKIICYNINKDLAELIRLTINKNRVNESFIYPELKQYASTILNNYLKDIV